VDTDPISGYPATSIAKFFEEEVQMAHQDKIIHETYDKKNELESYIYEMRSKVSDKYKDYVSVDIRDKFLDNLLQAESWLYQDGAKATKNAYVNKTDELKKIGEPIAKRFNEFASIPEAVANFATTLNGYESILLSNEANLSHITPEERQPVLATIHKLHEYLDNISKSIANMRKDQDPTITSKDINAKHEEFINANKAVINKPKPLPPKEEKKPDVPTANTQGQSAGNQGAPSNEEKKPEDKEEMDIEQ